MCNQISSNLFKNEITNKLISYIMYIYLNKYKQITDGNLLVLDSNAWNHLTMSEERINCK